MLPSPLAKGSYDQPSFHLLKMLKDVLATEPFMASTVAVIDKAKLTRGSKDIL
jgi:hypothetical protein